jgi:alpha-tubulin suppressor-like RCC1 family protein
VDSSTPVQAQVLPSGVIAVAVGGVHTCVIVNGAAQCWGHNSYGELGNGTTTDSLSPVQVSGLTADVTTIVANSQTCAIVNGAVKCWGLNDQSQLGDGTTTNRSTPVTVTGL